MLRYIWYINAVVFLLAAVVLAVGLAGVDPEEGVPNVKQSRPDSSGEQGPDSDTSSVLGDSDLIRLARAYGLRLEPPPPPKPVPPPPPKAGKLTATPPIHDFGLVDIGQVSKAEFVLNNTGEAALEITQVTPSRDCAVEELETKKLEPGGKVTLKVTYTAGENSGKVSNSVTVQSKSPAGSGRLVISLPSEVKTYVVAQPAKLNFDAKEDAPTEYKITLRGMQGLPFRVIGYLIDGDVASIALDTETEATVHELTLVTDRDKLKGQKSGMLTFKVDHPKVKQLPVAYTVTQPPPPPPPKKIPPPTFTVDTTLVIGSHGVMAWIKTAKDKDFKPYKPGEKVDTHYIITRIADGEVVVSREGSQFTVKVPQPKPTPAAAPAKPAPTAPTKPKTIRRVPSRVQPSSRR